MLSSLLALLLCGPANAALTPNGEIYLDEGVRRLYALDYEESRAAFRKLIELEPDNPFGYLFESGGIWWQSSMEYGLFLGTPTLQGLFEQDVEAALRKADPMTDSKDKKARADGHFVMGMALGTRGQWGLMRGHWLDAYFDGRKAIKHLKKCVKADEGYDDAYLGLGVFDYQAAHLPGILKLSAIVGVRGDEERGLQRITQAMDKGRYGARQAAQFLASIYIIDKHDYPRALPIVARLRADFPDSPYFDMLESFVRYRTGDWDGSLSLARVLFAKAEADPARFQRKRLSLYCGMTGEKCFAQKDLEEAVRWLDHAIETAQKERSLGSWMSFLRVHRGQAYDMLGLREDALKDYRWVLANKDFADGHARARECSAAACDAANSRAYLKALSKGEPWHKQLSQGDGPTVRKP